MEGRKDIQTIIEANLEVIIQLVKDGLPRWEPEPDYVIMRELGIYFS